MANRGHQGILHRATALLAEYLDRRNPVPSVNLPVAALQDKGRHLDHAVVEPPPVHGELLVLAFEVLEDFPVHSSDGSVRYRSNREVGVLEAVLGS